MLCFLTTLVILFIPPLDMYLRVDHPSNLSSRWKPLCYFIHTLGIKRDMPSDQLYGGKWILVRPHGIDGLLSSSRNAVVAAIALIRTVGDVICPFQLGKVNVLNWYVLNGPIRRFAERQGLSGVSDHTPRDGHDNASSIEFDGDRMFRAREFCLFFFHVLDLLLLEPIRRTWGLRTG